MLDFFPASVFWGVLLIFTLRVTDVTLGVIRIIMTVKGRSLVAGAIGFVEVTIFIVAIGQVLSHLDTVYHVLGYSSGFACGTILGGYIEKWMALGFILVNIHAKHHWRLVAGELRAEGFGVTEYEAIGKDGTVHVVETLVQRKRLPLVMDVVRSVAPDAFVHADEQQFIRQGYIRGLKRK